MPHISVIIPVYNAGNYIVDTLNSSFATNIERYRSYCRK